METKQIIRSLGALAQENRLAVFRLLVQAGPKGRSVGEIADALKMANATLSFHLKELTTAELIQARQDGRFIFYSANYPQMNDVIGYLTENCCGGEDCAPACETDCGPARSAKPAKAKSRRSKSRTRTPSR